MTHKETHGGACTCHSCAPVAAEKVAPRCTCPDDCNCHYPWRPMACGCTLHVLRRGGRVTA